MVSVITSFWSNLSSIIKTFPAFNNIIDVVVMAFIIYYALQLVRETRALQLLKSVGVILAIYFIANTLSMITLRFVIGKVLDAGLVFLVVLFQPELRRALEQIGRSKLTDLGKIGFSSTDDDQVQHLISTLSEACERLSKEKTGALIVIERDIKLGDIIATGTVIDSAPSEALFGSIFFSNSPLHDGALVIRGARLYAAGCFLPLSDNHTISRELGTRHRAALGISEVSDAIVLVVSEETGAISVAFDAKLQRGLSIKNLNLLLGAKLLHSSEEKKRRYFGRGRGRGIDE